MPNFTHWFSFARRSKYEKVPNVLMKFFSNLSRAGKAYFWYSTGNAWTLHKPVIIAQMKLETWKLAQQYLRVFWLFPEPAPLYTVCCIAAVARKHICPGNKLYGTMRTIC